MGAGPALVFSFLLLGTACALAALCYAEFASMIPIAGSAYTYSYATMGELVASIAHRTLDPIQNPNPGADEGVDLAFGLLPDLAAEHVAAALGEGRALKEFKKPEKSIPRSIGHHAEWIKACKDGSPTSTA